MNYKKAITDFSAIRKGKRLVRSNRRKESIADQIHIIIVDKHTAILNTTGASLPVDPFQAEQLEKKSKYKYPIN